MRRCNDELMHYGILGMKWGVRRYQNKDGTLTMAGRRKYRKDQKEHRSNLRKEYGQLEDQYTYGAKVNKRKNAQLDKRMREIEDELSYRKLKSYDDDSSVTKRVKKDYNTMTDQQFVNKYRCSKKTYAKRVRKYKDPYRRAKRQVDSINAYNKKTLDTYQKIGRKTRKVLGLDKKQGSKKTSFDKTYEKALAFSKNEGLPKPKKMANNTIGIPKANKNKNGEWIIEKDSNGNIKYDVWKIH